MFYPWLVVCVPLLLKQKVGFNCEGPPHIVGSSLTMLVKRVFPSTHTHTYPIPLFCCICVPSVHHLAYPLISNLCYYLFG